MSFVETRPGQGDEKKEKIFQRLLTDLHYRNTLADQSPSAPGYKPNLSKLARTIRDGIACAG